MNVSAPFIERPVATSLLAAAIMLAGATAYTQLPVAPLPRVDMPTISVNAALPGASPETMAASVAAPLERRFGRIAGVSEITSVSSLGSASLTLQFDLDRDVDAAARDVQAAINAASGDLPANLPSRPNYRKVNPADSPIMIVSLSSDALPLGQVFDQANTILAQKVSQVNGVGQVFVGGGQQPAVRVEADPAALAAAGLTLEDLRGVLSKQTLDAPKGLLSGANQATSIATNDQISHASDYAPVIISYVNGAALRVQDVAQVVDGVENARAAAWVGDYARPVDTRLERAVLLVVRRQPGANIIEVIERIKGLLPVLAASISPSIKVEMAFDRSTTIRASVHDVQVTLILSILLVVAVVFLFLRNGWATLIPSVAVPLSLVGTFGIMFLLGYSLDNLSLMALTISTGFVVDDAIVVTENVSRFIEAGDPPLTAALKGAKQIGFTIVSITISLLAVFIPILLMGGIIGRLFREFAVTLSIAIAVSSVISLTLTPMMCSRLLRPEHSTHGRLYNIAEAGFEALVSFYRRTLRWCLHWRWITFAIAILMVVLNVALFISAPKGLFPQQDTGMIMGFSDAPQDVSYAAMKERQEAVNKVMMEDPDIDHAVSFIGTGPSGGAVNTGTVFVSLKALPGRKATADEILTRLRPKLAQVPGIKLYLQAAQDLRVGGRSTRTQYQYSLQDANLDELNKWSPKVVEKLKTLKELKDVATDQQTAGLLLNVVIDRDTAARLGIQPQMVDDTLYDAYGQRQVTLYYTQLNEYHLVMEVKPAFQKNSDSLQSLYVRGPNGSPVPLSAIAHIEPAATSLSINHQGQFPAVTLSFNLAPGVALGEAVDAIHKAETEIGLPPSIIADFQGTAQVYQSSLATQKYLIMAALVTVYIVLGVLYESLVHPITILSTLPSAGVGAFLALRVMNTDFSLIALIGIILLIGIVKKNAIMMIDFAIEVERDKGVSAEEAIFEACVLRFRPILMTTMAALLGGVPLAIGHGNGAELRQPLGIAIVGGLIISQCLTLYTTPVIYLLLDELRVWFLDVIGWEGTDESGAPSEPVSAI